MKKRCKRCYKRSLPGLTSGNGLCAFHFAEYMWGRTWAEQCYPLQACLTRSEFCTGAPAT